MGTPTAFDEYPSVVTKSQDAVIAATKSWNEAVHAIKLPKPGEFVATGYRSREKLLASQRRFAVELMSLTAGAASRA